jgi:hypothetical protein
MMAIVDAQNGRVYGPPMSEADVEFNLFMDPMGDHEIDFRLDSSLMILRNACKTGRNDCGVYAFQWRNDQFVLVKRVLDNLADAGLPK